MTPRSSSSASAADVESGVWAWTGTQRRAGRTTAPAHARKACVTVFSISRYCHAGTDPPPQPCSGGQAGILPMLSRARGQAGIPGRIDYCICASAATQPFCQGQSRISHPCANPKSAIRNPHFLPIQATQTVSVRRSTPQQHLHRASQAQTPWKDTP